MRTFKPYGTPANFSGCIRNPNFQQGQSNLVRASNKTSRVSAKHLEKDKPKVITSVSMAIKWPLLTTRGIKS